MARVPCENVVTRQPDSAFTIKFSKIGPQYIQRRSSYLI